MKRVCSVLLFLFLLTGCAFLAEQWGVSPGQSAEPADTVPVSSDTALVEQLKAITPKVALGERGIVVQLQGLVFKLGASSLTPNARIQLRDISNILIKKGYTDRLVAVEGHTDAIGGKQRNLSLSKRRAEVVAGELTLNRVPSSRIMVRGYGERFPLESSESEEGSKESSSLERNRRVELIIGYPFSDIQERSR